jgi:hypothetical protein
MSWAYDLNYWGAMVTAIATACIAWFTWTLRQSSIAQAQLTQKSIELATAEFVATHRPKIVVHSVEYSVNVPENYVEAGVTYLNCGDTEAKDIVISGDIFTFARRPTTGVLIREITKHGLCGPGVRREFDVSSKIPAVANETSIGFAEEDGGEDHPSDIYCIGTIDYLDRNDVKRTTGFCWRLHGHRWVRQSRSGYEYSY